MRVDTSMQSSVIPICSLVSTYISAFGVRSEVAQKWDENSVA